jgi:hypothetical protein
MIDISFYSVSCILIISKKKFTKYETVNKFQQLGRKVDGMQKLLDASTAIASLYPFGATENIIFEACRILDCDRSTIFTLDKITQELVLSVAEGAKNIRVPIGQVQIVYLQIL